jgi:exodeoxyribonuclease V alpha subunit
MAKHQIPSPIQQRIIRHHGAETIEAIRNNPYTLLAFGMSFGSADNISFKHFKLNDNDPKRLSAAIEQVLRDQISKGHTYTNESELLPALKKLLNNSELAKAAIVDGGDKCQYIYKPNTETYHPTAVLFMEAVISKRLKALAKNIDLFDDDVDKVYKAAIAQLPYQLTKEQCQAVANALDNGVSLITGGAGTGKTTVLLTVLRAYHQLGFSIHATALSGRAAMRLHESIGFKTSTIAALLRNEPIEPSTDEPNHLLVIDESSMLDVPTMYRLVTHCHPSTRILLTGDPNQLPPIGAGKILADIVSANSIVNSQLNIVKRQGESSGIPEYSKLINEGIVPEQLTTGAITFHETPVHQIEQRCMNLFLKSPEKSRVMAPTRKMVSDINVRIQNAVNRDGKPMAFELNGDKMWLDIRLNDQILFTQNFYDKGIQNGSLGKLVSVESNDDIFGVAELDTGTKIEINQAILDSIQLGYAITLHKAQGSQFPIVIVALKSGRITDRAWLYTAITRAESEIHIVGSEKDFRAITEAPSKSHQRNSWLSTLLS